MIAGIWLFADMSLNLTALSIVKVIDGEFASIQLVFIRACVGLLLIVPFVYYAKIDLHLTSKIKLQLLRAALAAIALTCSFYAVANLPIAFFVTLNFTRPLLLMFFAVILLHETINRSRWIAGAVGLLGAAIAANPQNIPWSAPMGALVIAIVAGTVGVIVLRKLKGSPWQTVMLYYAGGITVLTCLPAIHHWQQPNTNQWVWLLGLAVLTQCAQFCFMRAHWLGEAGFLAPLGYFSLVLSAIIGLVFFNEVVSLATVCGAIVIVVATLIQTRTAKH